MAWIKIYGEVWESPKLIALAEKLSISEQATMGYLLSLWCFTERNAWRDGDLTKWGVRGIAKAAGWAGEAQAWVSALQETRWLDPGTLLIHKWTVHQAELIRIRSKHLPAPSTDKVRTNSALDTEQSADKVAESRAEQSRDKSITTTTCAEEPQAAPPQEAEGELDAEVNGEPLIDFPLPGTGSYTVTDAHLSDWQTAYPGVDIKAELAKMRVWLLENPKNRKTSKGIPRFIASWLGRAQDKGGARGPAPKKTQNFEGW